MKKQVIHDTQNTKFKEIVIFVTGTTPQIITETIYGLIHKDSPIFPDEIYILTTNIGAEVLNERLINSGKFSKFCKEYGLDEKMLDSNSIIIMRDQKGDFLSDIKKEP